MLLLFLYAVALFPELCTAISVCSVASAICLITKTGAVACSSNTLDGSNTLVGPDNAYKFDVPAANFVHIACGSELICGITESNEAVCWGLNIAQECSVPPGRYLNLAIGGEAHVSPFEGRGHFVCAIRVNRTLACWGQQTNPALYPAPSGQFLQICCGLTFACALQSDNAILCFGAAPFSIQSTGPFVHISCGRKHLCALDSLSRMHCFGEQTEFDGSVVQVSSEGSEGQCAVRPDGTVSCSALGPFQNEAMVYAAPGDITSVGITRNRELAIWGQGSQAASPPAGRFSAIDARSNFGCAIRTEDSEVWIAILNNI
jgi:alpha-tubulin suppressor-like RCC1 family protein